MTVGGVVTVAPRIVTIDFGVNSLVGWGLTGYQKTAPEWQHNYTVKKG